MANEQSIYYEYIAKLYYRNGTELIRRWQGSTGVMAFEIPQIISIYNPQHSDRHFNLDNNKIIKLEQFIYLTYNETTSPREGLFKEMSLTPSEQDENQS